MLLFYYTIQYHVYIVFSCLEKFQNGFLNGVFVKEKQQQQRLMSSITKEMIPISFGLGLKDSFNFIVFDITYLH